MRKMSEKKNDATETEIFAKKLFNEWKANVNGMFVCDLYEKIIGAKCNSYNSQM